MRMNFWKWTLAIALGMCLATLLWYLTFEFVIRLLTKMIRGGIFY